MRDRFPRKFDVQTSYICCEHQISSGNLSHDSALDRRTLLFNSCRKNVVSNKKPGIRLRQSQTIEVVTIAKHLS